MAVPVKDYKRLLTLRAETVLRTGWARDASTATLNTSSHIFYYRLQQSIIQTPCQRATGVTGTPRLDFLAGLDIERHFFAIFAFLELEHLNAPQYLCRCIPTYCSSYFYLTLCYTSGNNLSCVFQLESRHIQARLSKPSIYFRLFCLRQL